MQNKKKISLLTTTLIALGLIIAFPIFAQTNPGSTRGMGRGGQRPAVVGTVSAINGNTLTVSGRQGFNNTAAATYTVDASNAKITKNNTAGTISSIAVGDTVMVQGTVNGTNVTATTIRDGQMGQGGMRGGMGVAGTVASINGTTLTVTSKGRPNGGTATTYTVDASNTTVTKNETASSVSNIAVGDTVMVQGTVSGTNVTAKTIRDGVQQPQIQGNGQPVVAGAVTIINGNSITITNKSNVTYTVDATNAKFVINGVASPTISNVAVGDNLIVQGTVNGNSVSASSVIDQKAKTNNNANNSGSSEKSQGFLGGVMGGINGIGNFFKHMFGF